MDNRVVATRGAGYASAMGFPSFVPRSTGASRALFLSSPLWVGLALGACGSPAPRAADEAHVQRASAASSSSSKATEDSRDDAAIVAACQRYLDLVVRHSPERATALGIHTRDAELDDRSLEAASQAIADREAMLEALRREFPSPRATRASKTDLELLIATLESEVATEKTLRPLERNPTLYASPLTAVFLIMAREFAPAPERARNAIARFEKAPAVVAQAKKNLKNPPRVWTQVALEMAEAGAAFFGAQRAALERALPGEKKRIAEAIRIATTAYKDYAAFLRRELLPRSTGDYAAGQPLFELLLKKAYFVDEDSTALLALGKRIFAETRRNMTEVARRIDPKLEWPEVVRRVKGNHPTAEELLPSYRKEVARARAFLVEKDVVPFPPNDDLEVLETPEFQRSTVTAAYDHPPPFDVNTTKGFFFVTPVDLSLPQASQLAMLRENDHGDQVDTVVHEAYPGHHLQLSFARLHPSLIRKMTDAAIFSEGWGLYSEELMAELGYYTDEERLMQLEWTLVRAARVVIDVGLHTQGMTFDDALKMLTDEVHLEAPLALSEVKRYTLSPTQPLSYLVGREAIFKLRQQAKARWGEGFTLKRFHEAILARGSIPPGLIARELF